MTTVCYNKPNRTKARPFRERDIARITRYAIDDGADPLTILKYVIVVTGFGAVICKVASAISLYEQAKEIVKELGATLAKMTLVNFLVLRFGQALLKYSVIAQLIIVVNALQDLMLSGVTLDEVGDAVDVEQAISFITEICDDIGATTDTLIDYVR